MNKKFVVLALLAIVGIMTFRKYLVPKRYGQTIVPSASVAPKASATGFTMPEIALHATASDCWMAIDNNVYNVSSYTNIHPGGRQILSGCGTDASSMFNGIGKHMGARQILATFKIGSLVN